MLLLLWGASPALAVGFRCAGSPDLQVPPAEEAAAKPARPSATTGTRQALVLFARFKGESTALPSWATDIFNPELPGSFSHFYDTMSFGKLRVRGEVAPRVYESEQPVSAYLSGSSSEQGRFGQFSQEILRQADGDIDFAQFDNDGPDGIPNSGDDDGIVDAVFLVLLSVPRDFLRGAATGIGYLGLGGGFATGDTGISGKPIHVLMGTVQQGKSFSEAVGSMCHEYGHVLDLPDLFNAEFQGGTGPEEDSAGVGAWCLMGWGALGWQGNNGPNSFCAWSRARLGWAEMVEIRRTPKGITLEEVGQGGAVYKVPVTAREYFLLEYRQRAGNYYDRNIPGEGLLIWHVEQGLITGARVARFTVDLECADGRWLDAGYPLGQQPDSEKGEDNLDFWAHDQHYAQQHAGNLGDATDPFDGVRFVAFTPETNPDSYSNDQRRSVRIEGIRLEEGMVFAQVQTEPMLIELKDLQLRDEDGDEVLMAGERLQLHFKLSNQGGLNATALRVVLSSPDSVVEILQPEAHLDDLGVGQESFRLPREGAYPALRFADHFAGAHTAEVSLEVYAGDELVEVETFSLTAVSPRQVIREVSVVDSLGNGDGQVQAGEIINLSVEIEAERAELLRPVTFRLRPLHPAVSALGSAHMGFRQLDKAMAVSGPNPEFLVRSTVEAGSWLGFELSAASRFGAWKDTIFVRVEKGPDPTAPRIGIAQIRQQGEDLRIVLPETQIVEGSPIRRAEAVLYDRGDTTQIAQVPLSFQGDGFQGVWRQPAPGTYLLRVQVEDEAGNQGWGLWRLAAVLGPLQENLPAFPPAAAGHWQSLGPPGDHWISEIHSLALARPQIIYLGTASGLWRSADGGSAWAKTGLMLSGDHQAWLNKILVDAQDPFTVYLAGEGLRSWDGGEHWEPIAMPGGEEVALLAADPVQGGRLYASGQRRLWISEDGGDSWRETAVTSPPGFSLSLVVHPADPRWIYASTYNPANATEPASLFRSEDGGRTWKREELEAHFVSLAPDPRDPRALYQLSWNSVWYHSADGGASWQDLDKNPGFFALAVHPLQPALLYGWSPSNTFWRSEDGGASWESTRQQDLIGDLLLHPWDPYQAFMTISPIGSFMAGERAAFLRTEDGGQFWQQVELPDSTAAPVGALAFDRDGWLYAGSGGNVWSHRRLNQPAVFASADGGSTWEWRLRGEWDLFFDSVFFESLLADPVNPQLILGQTRGIYLRSEDAGQHWTITLRREQDSQGQYQEILADPRQSGVYYAFAGSQIFRSADGGETWKELARIWTSRVGGLALDPEDSRIIYAAAGSQVWRSEDGGASWRAMGAVGEPIFALAMHPLSTSRIYAATPAGLYASEDQGRTWKWLVGPAQGKWKKGRIRFAPADPQVLYLVSPRQLLESRDTGKTWSSLGGDLAGYPWFNDVAIDPFDNRTVYVATPWGVYRLDADREITAVGEVGATPQDFSLDPNYPNPFNPATTLRFSLPQPGEAELSIYNLLGQRVATLVQGAQEAGPHQMSWDGRDDRGRELASGVYLCRLQAGAQVETRKLLLLR